MNAISVIMPCHNRGYDLNRVLQAYDQQVTSEPFELIAIDDASTDNTYQVLANYRPQRYQLRIERLEKNSGQGQARNHGLEFVDSPLVLFVGDDILPDKRLISAHLQNHRKFPQKEIAILGKIIWPADIPVNYLMAHIDGVGAEQFSYYYLQDGQEYDFRHLYTSNISLKLDLIKSLDHWFDTEFTLYGYEDVELSYRLSHHGMRIIYSSAPLAYHYHYHNTWTFSTRQYNAGLMACVLTKKHPELSRRIKGQGWTIKLFLRRILSTFQSISAEQAEWLETQALCLASMCEEQPHRLSDPFFITLWHYFHYKGLLEGSLPGEAGKKVSHSYTARALAPLLTWFIKESERNRDPLPNGFGKWTMNQVER